MTYGEYLKISELLQLQRPLSDGPEHDETLFIIIHQVYELWFKQVLHEVIAVDHRLQIGETVQAIFGLKRILTIFKTLVQQVDVLETMTPLSFLSFRNRLESASGFQSVQFRELEFRLGHRSRERLAKLPDHHRATLEPLLSSDSLYDSLLVHLHKKGHAMPDSVLHRSRDIAHRLNDEVQKSLINVYRTDPLLQDLCERFVDLDEGIQEWRYRHVKMVERTIGFKMGTGGPSGGAGYLRSTLLEPLFADLWAIRTAL